MTGKQGDSPS